MSARRFLVRGFIAAAIVFAALGVGNPAQAEVLIWVMKSRQAMYVYVDGTLVHSWLVSTGREGYSTPIGSFRPTFLSPFHRSSRYHNAPMPYSIFFHRGYAIHGSYDVDRLGEPASHGCIRLHPEDARELYDLVQEYGMDDTRIMISR